MLLLTGTSDLLSIVTSAPSTIDVHASWVDNASGIITPGKTNTPTISTATTTTVVAAPAGDTQRNIKFLSIRNRDASAACDVTLKLTDGVNNLELIKATINAGEELHYLDGMGFEKLLAGSGSPTAAYNNANVTITGGAISGVAMTGSTVQSKTGTALAAGLNVPASSTLTTAAVQGDVEFDANCPYFTSQASGRGVIPSEQLIIQRLPFTLTSQTAAQKMFNASANGTLTLDQDSVRAYMFECGFDLSSMSTTSGSFGFALAGTATFTSLKWWSEANKAALATAAAAQHTLNTTTSNAAIVTASISAVGWAKIKGILRVSGGGTIIPQVSLGIAAAAVVGSNSYFRLWPVGSNLVTNVGNWT